MLLPYITLHFISCYNIDTCENQRSLSYCIFSNSDIIQFSLHGNMQFRRNYLDLLRNIADVFFRIHVQVEFICYTSRKI